MAAAPLLTALHRLFNHRGTQGLLAFQNENAVLVAVGPELPDAVRAGIGAMMRAAAGR